MSYGHEKANISYSSGGVLLNNICSLNWVFIFQTPSYIVILFVQMLSKDFLFCLKVFICLISTSLYPLSDHFFEDNTPYGSYMTTDVLKIIQRFFHHNMVLKKADVSRSTI